MSTFVCVGNATQPFSRLLDAVCGIAEYLPQPVVVQYGAADDYSCPKCSVVAYMDMMEFEKHVAEAELLIMHAGAGSVIHAVRSGNIPVVMPRHADLGEHIDNHQLEFSHQLEETSKILVANDAATLLDVCNLSLSRQIAIDENNISEPPLVKMVKDLIEGDCG